MKIATVQFDSKIRRLKDNIAIADSLLESINLEGVQLLACPELAFTGYNFASLQAIGDYLEPTCAGPTAWWAAKIAKLYGVVVSIGYPEITTSPEKIPPNVLPGLSLTLDAAIQGAQNYVSSVKVNTAANATYFTFNSMITVGPEGKVLAHYRKTHLYYTDVTWASPSIEGFTTTSLSFSAGQQTKTSFAICMDLNPSAFTASWEDYEVANYVLSNQASLLIVSTAWITRENAAEANDVSPCCPEAVADKPGMESLLYWIERLMPLIKEERETIVVIANRIGNEEGLVKACDLENLVKPMFRFEHSRKETVPAGKNVKEPEDLTELSSSEALRNIDESIGFAQETNTGIVSTSAHYAGTSAVFCVGNGQVSVYGVLGRGVQRVLIADTDDKAVMSFRIKSQEDAEGEGEEEDDDDSNDSRSGE